MDLGSILRLTKEDAPGFFRRGGHVFRDCSLWVTVHLFARHFAWCADAVRHTLAIKDASEVNRRVYSVKLWN